MKVSARLHAIAPIITEILRISGGEGVAIGVLHHGEAIHHANFGYRNVNTKQVPDQDTIFQIASLSKAFTAAAVGILVEKNRLTWNTPLHEVLPEFRSTEDAVTKYCTIVDLLAHRHGLSGPGSIWLQGNNKILLQQEDLIPTFSTAKAKFSFRRQFAYSNLGVAMAGHVVEKLSGQSLSEFLLDHIFRPLGMNRTSIDLPPAGAKNMAHAYAALENTTRVSIRPPRIDANTFMAPAIGVRSTVRDLLIAYKHLMQSANEQFLASSLHDSVSIFKQTSEIFTSRVPLRNTPAFREQTYGLGWARAQLPGPLGAIGHNEDLLTRMPDVGRGFSNLVIYHQGDLAGSLSAVYLLPESESAIVVLSNSMALNDVADWIGQLLLETLLDVPGPEKRDFVHLARQTASKSIEIAKKTEKDLAHNRKHGTYPRSLNLYCGKYYNELGNFFIEIRPNSEGLQLSFQGLDLETYDLRHYHDDVFEWSLGFNDIARRARLIVDDYHEYLLSFVYSDKPVGITSLTWVTNSDFPEGEVFTKILEDNEKLGMQ